MSEKKITGIQFKIHNRRSLIWCKIGMAAEKKPNNKIAKKIKDIAGDRSLTELIIASAMLERYIKLCERDEK